MNRFDRSVRLRFPNPVIPIEKQPAVLRDTVVRSEIAAAGPVDDAACVLSGSAKRIIESLGLSLAVFLDGSIVLGTSWK